MTRLDAFSNDWDLEYIHINYKSISGSFYPNERALSLIRQLFLHNDDINYIILDGDFDLINNFDDEFYAFAHLSWNKHKWILYLFRYDKKIIT